MSIEGNIQDAQQLLRLLNSYDTYLKVFPTEENLGITIEEGININKLDKGCLKPVQSL